MLNNALLLFFCFFSSSEEKISTQQLEVEWEAKQHAVGYEILLKSLEKDKAPLTATTEQTIFKQEVPSGIYTFQVRAKYKNNQYGNWSLPVQLIPLKVQLLEPKDSASVVVRKKPKAPVTFVWSEAQDAQQYRLKYWSDKDKTIKVFSTAKTKSTQLLDVDTIYYWKIELITKAGVQLQNSSDTYSFYLAEGELPPIQISDFELNENGGDIPWQRSKQSLWYSGKLFYRRIFAETWELVVENVKISSAPWSIHRHLEPGEYKLQIIGFAHEKHHTPTFEKIFLIKPKAPELQPVVQTDL